MTHHTDHDGFVDDRDYDCDDDGGDAAAAAAAGDDDDDDDGGGGVVVVVVFVALRFKCQSARKLLDLCRLTAFTSSSWFCTCSLAVAC